MYELQPKGLNIKDNDRNVPDGFLQESINLQWKDGSYKPIPSLLDSGITNTLTSNKIILHKVSDEDVVNVLAIFPGSGLKWMGYIENGVYNAIAPTTVSGFPIVTDFDSLSFTILNGIIYFMSVTQEFYYSVEFDETIVASGIYIARDMYEWKGNYPLFKSGTFGGLIPTGYSAFFCGMLLMRYTFVLDTGEEVLHSPIYPYKVQAAVPTGASSGDTLSNIHTVILLSLSFGVSISDRIVGLNVYTTTIKSMSKYGSALVSSEIPGKIKSMISDNMYLVASLDINDVISPNFSAIMITVGDFILNPFTGIIVDSNTLPSGKSIPIDNFTHHKLFGRITSSNGRLVISSPKVKMTNGYLLSCCREQAAGGWSTLKNNFTAKTEDGLVYGSYESQSSFDADSSVFRGVVSYPDYRATVVSLQTTGTSSGFYKYYLNPKPSINMSTNFDITSILTISDLYNIHMNYSVLSAWIESGDSQYTSNNRIQFSEFGEFSVWPVLNSYRVGEGKIVFVGSNSIDPSNTDYISPLLIGTSDGVYTANFDPTGVNLIQSITKAANLPALSDKNILIDQNLIYVSDKGLIVVNNGKVINITEEYFPEFGNGNFPDNNTVYPNYTLLTPYPSPDLSGDDFQITDIIDYMKGALFAYDGRRNNVWCSNPTESFSLIYNLKSRQWTMCTTVFDEVIDFGGLIDTANGEIYSRYLVVVDGIVRILSSENLTSKVYTHLLTRPIKMQSPEQYKKIQSLFSRCELYRDDANGYFTFGIWGKQDLNKDKVNIPLAAYVDDTSNSFPGNIRQNIPVGNMKGKYKSITILQGGYVLPNSSIDNYEIIAIAVENNKIR